MYTESSDFDEKKAYIKRMFTQINTFYNKNGFDEFNDMPKDLALEVGGSGGLASGLLSFEFEKVICTDITDINCQYDGQFSKLLKEKFQRQELDLNLRKLEFHTVDAQSLIYMDNLFDFVFSFNALEHIQDPLVAIKEMFRVVKPGGCVFFSFDPVWTADTGSHFYNYIKSPWLHLLKTDNEITEIMRANGASDVNLEEYVVAMNRKSSTFYSENLPILMRENSIAYDLHSWSGCTEQGHLIHRNLNLASDKLGITKQDLLVRGFSGVAKKKDL